MIAKPNKNVFVVVQNSLNKGNSVMSLTVGKNTKGSTLFASKKSAIVKVTFALDESLLIVATTTSFYIIDLTNSSHPTKKFRVGASITAIAASRSKPRLAVGDAKGQIHLFHCLDSMTEESHVATKLHWHAHSVDSLAFTPDEAYLVSGGQEAVLVLWQADSHHKQFVPRLGAQITAICVSNDQKYFAVSHADNCIRIISAADMSVKLSISGVKAANVCKTLYPMDAFTVHPKTSHVVFNGYPGSLQVYDPLNDQHVAEIDVSHRNRVTRNDRGEIRRPHVHFARLSDNGDWMATIDVRKDVKSVTETYLKFWKYHSGTREYSLHTRVDQPHDDDITSLSFRRSVNGQSLLAVTTGLDHRFKIWELVLAENDMQSTNWVCRSAAFYKEMPIRSASFSSDGSILAVAYDSAVTLWNPLTSLIYNVLPYPCSGQTIQKVAFLTNSPSLVVATDSHIHLWDITSCTVVWSLKMSSFGLEADPSSPSFMVWAQSSDEKLQTMFVFGPETPVPIFAKEFKAVSIKSSTAAFIPVSSGSSDIVLLDNDFNLQVLSSRDSKTAPKETETIAIETPEQSLFSSIYGESIYQPSIKKTLEEDTDEDSRGTRNIHAEAARFFDAPSHVISGPSKLFDSFMDCLMKRNEPDLDKSSNKMLVEEHKEEKVSEKEPIELTTAVDVESLSFLDQCLSNLQL